MSTYLENSQGSSTPVNMVYEVKTNEFNKDMADAVKHVADKIADCYNSAEKTVRGKKVNLPQIPMKLDIRIVQDPRAEVREQTYTSNNNSYTPY